MAEHRLTFPTVRGGRSASCAPATPCSSTVTSSASATARRSASSTRASRRRWTSRARFLLHTAPERPQASATARYEKICIGTTTSARMVRFTEPLGRDYGVRAICGKGGLPDEAIEPMQRLGMVYFAIVGGAAALETTQIEEIEEVDWEELMPECLWKFRVKDFGPLTVGDRLARHLALPRRPGSRRRSDWRISMPGSNGSERLPRRAGPLAEAARAGAHARHRQGAEPPRHRGPLRHGRASTSTSSSSAGARRTSRTTSRRRSRSTARSRRRSSAAGRSSRPSSRAGKLDEYRSWLTENRFSHVEVSDGTIDLPRERKLELIAELAQRLRRPLRGRLEGRGGRLRALPVGRVDAGGARRRRLEGDHRGPRGRQRRHLPADGEMRTGPDRRDRPRDRARRHHLRGADEGLAGLVRASSSGPRSTSATSRPTRSSRSRRSASGSAPTR